MRAAVLKTLFFSAPVRSLLETHLNRQLHADEIREHGLKKILIAALGSRIEGNDPKLGMHARCV